MRKLYALTSAVALAEDLVGRELERQFPAGSTIRVRAQTNHPGGSDVTVVSHPGGRNGMLRVRFASGHCTTVPYTAVVECG